MNIKKIITLFVLFVCLKTLIHPISSPLTWEVTTDDFVSTYAKKFECLRDRIPPNERIGYLATDDGSRDVDVAQYYLLNYTLAPLVISNDPTAEWVIVNFQDRTTGLTIIEKIFNQGYTIDVDCMSGVFLIQRNPVK